MAYREPTPGNKSHNHTTNSSCCCCSRGWKAIDPTPDKSPRKWVSGCKSMPQPAQTASHICAITQMYHIPQSTNQSLETRTHIHHTCVCMVCTAIELHTECSRTHTNPNTWNHISVWSSHRSGQHLWVVCAICSHPYTEPQQTTLDGAGAGIDQRIPAFVPDASWTVFHTWGRSTCVYGWFEFILEGQSNVN